MPFLGTNEDKLSNVDAGRRATTPAVAPPETFNDSTNLRDIFQVRVPIHA
jgi:hypothetical protein